MPSIVRKAGHRIPLEQRCFLKGGGRANDPILNRMLAVTDPNNPIKYTSNDTSSKTKKAKMMAKKKATPAKTDPGQEPQPPPETKKGE